MKDSQALLGGIIVFFLISTLIFTSIPPDLDLVTSIGSTTQNNLTTGNLYVNGTFRQGDDDNMFIYDIDEEIHHVNVDLSRFDEIRANTFTTDLHIETFCNATGNYVNITADDGGRISFIANYLGSAVSESFPETEYILELTAGTNETPVLNRVYAIISGGEPTWVVSITEPTVAHAMASRILVGASGCMPYASALQEDGDNGFLKRVQRRFRKEGLLYESGLDYNSSANSLAIGSGNYINGIYDQSISNPLNTSDGFYLVRFDGTFQWYNSFDDITQYSDGNTIGTNKYFNVIFGITPYDGEGNIYAVVQSQPSNDYTSVIDAYSDNDNTLKVYPSEEFLKTFFLPVARMVLNEGNGANILPNGMYAEDYRGGVAGGANSGGGLTESDPVWSLEKDNYFNKTETNSTGLIGLVCDNGKIAEMQNGEWECATDSTGTDDQTLAEVLAQGNDANGLNITNVDTINANNIISNESLTVGSFGIKSDLNVGGNIETPNSLVVGIDETPLSFMTPKAKFVADLNTISGVQMGNINNGTSAGYRFIIKDDSDHYFAFSQPGTNNSNSDIWGHPRKYTDFIFNAGGTARSMAIGTASGQGKTYLASGGIDAIEISNTTQNLTLSSLAGSYTGGSAYVCVNDAGTIYASEVACP